MEVLAGLAGSSHMVAATIGCLSRLVFEFHGKQREMQCVIVVVSQSMEIIHCIRLRLP